MNVLKRVTEWLLTAEGMAKALVSFFTVCAAIWATVKEEFDPLFDNIGLSSWAIIVLISFIAMILAWLLWSSYRRYDRASRLEHPEALTLHPTDPDSLIGRKKDIEKLTNCVKRNRLVLLDGESGCGKSALVSAGLLPTLHQQPGDLLPLVIRDWGDDWERGPLSAGLDALYHSLAQSERDRMGWSSPPDLAADAPNLATDLYRWLNAVFVSLNRRPLIIADQFDDFQAQYRSQFLDREGSWLTPAALAKANQFWSLVSSGLSESHLHLLVVTRADTAASLACVRFLDNEQINSRTLHRVDAEFLRPLLKNIASDETQPAVISNPANGWHDLRECLERDLKAEGAILMQQVRTVLLGLRRLPLLTSKCYRANGGLRGLEKLAVKRALETAAGVIGSVKEELPTTRAVLAELLPGSANQSPKAKRATISELSTIAGDQRRAEAILNVLQDEEIVRPADSIGGVNSWQLDHVYLAHAVLAEKRQAEYWAVALQEGKARYDAAVGSLRIRWKTLLPVGTLMRVFWERVRGRLSFDDAASYVRMSTIRPGIFLLGFAFITIIAYSWNQERLLTKKASQLVALFGSDMENDAVLRVWRGPTKLRRRVFELVHEDEGRFARARASRWVEAHAGFEGSTIRERAIYLAPPTTTGCDQSGFSMISL